MAQEDNFVYYILNKVREGQSCGSFWGKLRAEFRLAERRPGRKLG